MSPSSHVWRRPHRPLPTIERTSRLASIRASQDAEEVRLAAFASARCPLDLVLHRKRKCRLSESVQVVPKDGRGLRPKGEERARPRATGPVRRSGQLRSRATFHGAAADFRKESQALAEVEKRSRLRDEEAEGGGSCASPDDPSSSASCLVMCSRLPLCGELRDEDCSLACWRCLQRGTLAPALRRRRQRAPVRAMARAARGRSRAALEVRNMLVQSEKMKYSTLHVRPKSSMPAPWSPPRRTSSGRTQARRPSRRRPPRSRCPR